MVPEIAVGNAVQDSAAPEASTPRGNDPAEQLAPLATRAVAVPALPEVLKLPVPEIFAAFVVSVVALAASPVTRAAGTIPAARLPLISTFHNVAPAAFLNSKKFPVGKVSVTRCDNSAVFPFADWLIVTPVSVGDALNTALLLPVSVW